MNPTEDELAELQAAFFKTYANVPLNIREEIVIVIDGEPLTWNVAFIEVNAATTESEKILHALRELSII